MAGYFEVVDVPEGGYRIRMVDGAGRLMAVSITFPTKRAAVAGIAQAREIAGTGLIRDRSGQGQQPEALATFAKRRTGAGRGSTLPGSALSAANLPAPKRTRAHN